VVSDAGDGATNVEQIRFVLDPDTGNRLTGATPDGAMLSLNDQGSAADLTDDTWDFSWTPSASQTGTFRLFLIATDDGGDANVPLSDVYSFELVIDNQPIVDLNGADGDGVDFGPVTFTEADDSAPIRIVDVDLSIQASNDRLASATVEIANPQPGGSELLAVIDASSLEVDRSTNGKLVLSVVGGGLAEKSLFEQALRSLTYNNTSDNPLVSRTINVTVNNGIADSNAAKATVNIQRTNDRPDLRTVPGAPDANVGEEYILKLVATDPDGGDLLVFRITSGPEDAVISPNGLPDNSSDNTIQVSQDEDGFYRAQIGWTPTVAEGAAGSALFVVSATDTGGLADTEIYQIGIEGVDDPANPQVVVVSDIDVSLDVSEVVILFNEAMGTAAFAVSSYSLTIANGSTQGDPLNVLSASRSDERTVVLELNDNLINSISSVVGGTTKVTLALDSQIDDLDGNVLAGPLEFEIDLTS